MQFKNGSLFLFRLFGVNVFVHWSWALVGAIEIARQDARDGSKQPLLFYIAQYLCLFLIVLLHEFGHALACKSVGGKAERITLWPLGGVAYVQPPPRPGPTLWSIAAGPLVNVILVPLTIALVLLATLLHNPTLHQFFTELAIINVVLLIFNMLPVYPLDGGQILRSLIWFFTSRGTSLLIAAWIGIAGSAALLSFAVSYQQVWLGLVVAYMGYRSFLALKIANAYRKLDSGPRHTDARCPACGEHPPIGPHWLCPCKTKFDTFATNAQCPACRKQFNATRCVLCGKPSPRPLWHSTSGFPVSTNEPLIVTAHSTPPSP